MENYIEKQVSRATEIKPSSRKGICINVSFDHVDQGRDTSVE
jgi:hypothetical protein